MTNKPTEKRVALIGPSHFKFTVWLKLNRKENVVYIWVYHMDRAVGHDFDKGVLLKGYPEIKDVEDIIEYVENKCKIKFESE
jgi:hypothetical protein